MDSSTNRWSTEAPWVKLKKKTIPECTAADVRRLAASCECEAGSNSLNFADLTFAERETATAAHTSQTFAEQETTTATHTSQSSARSTQSAQEIPDNPAGDENGDRNADTCVLACLAYMLPRVDGIQSGLYVLQIIFVMASLLCDPPYLPSSSVTSR